MGKANTESTQTTTPAPTGLMLTVTNSAAEKVAALLQRDNPELKLRIYIVGGGCSGFNMGLLLTLSKPVMTGLFLKH